MKKSFLTTTFLIAGAVGLLAQGKVAFDNMPYSFADSIENGGAVDYKVYSAPGVLVNNSAWSVQLYQNGVAVGAKIPFFGDALPGVWDTSVDGTDYGVRTLSTAGGVATTLQVAVFNGNTELGRSPAFSYTAPTSPTPPPDAMLMSNFRAFVVPEPSTIALGVLGLGALLLFRRRK